MNTPSPRQAFVNCRIVDRGDRGFTLIELLVVISIIALLIALLLPALEKARSTTQSVQCGSRQRQLLVALNAYSADNDENFPYMQEWVPNENGGGLIEYSWRGILYPYTSNEPASFDCPSESEEVYAEQAFDERGRMTSEETFLPSGLGAVNVHWRCGYQNYRPPFGRYDPKGDQSGYTDSTATLRCNWGLVVNPSELICFGDGNSSRDYLGRVRNWPEDSFWIYKVRNQCAAGYNRARVPAWGNIAEQGLERHGGPNDANYALADGSVKMLNANDIPCSREECWWDAQITPHN